MAQVLVDTGFIVALLSRDDQHHPWAKAQVSSHPHPWYTCEAVLSEAFHLLEPRGTPQLAALLERGVLQVKFDFAQEMAATLSLIKKYADVPMSLADGILVRMSELITESILLTTDGDFRGYRRLGRKVIPCRMPDLGKV